MTGGGLLRCYGRHIRGMQTEVEDTTITRAGSRTRHRGADYSDGRPAALKSAGILEDCRRWGGQLLGEGFLRWGASEGRVSFLRVSPNWAAIHRDGPFFLLLLFFFFLQNPCC